MVHCMLVVMTIQSSLSKSYVFMQLQLFLKMIAILKSSNRVGSNVIQNLRTIMVYHVLHGLLPQLGAGPPAPAISASSAAPADRHDSGGGVGLTKLLGHVKFSVPLVDWTHQALENLRLLCEELASEGNDDVSVVIGCVECLFSWSLIWSIFSSCN